MAVAILPLAAPMVLRDCGIDQLALRRVTAIGAPGLELTQDDAGQISLSQVMFVSIGARLPGRRRRALAKRADAAILDGSR